MFTLSIERFLLKNIIKDLRNNEVGKEKSIRRISPIAKRVLLLLEPLANICPEAIVMSLESEMGGDLRKGFVVKDHLTSDDSLSVEFFVDFPELCSDLNRNSDITDFITELVNHNRQHLVPIVSLVESIGISLNDRLNNFVYAINKTPQGNLNFMASWSSDKNILNLRIIGRQ